MERHLEPIPKIIHICWKTKDILERKSVFLENTVQKLVNLADGWTPVISDDADVEQYLKDNMSFIDYYRIKDRHIVEKIDLWRLYKMYNEGGLYSDIDRLCNTSINSVLNEETRCVLPTCLNHDFSQDFMCSSPNNPIYFEAIQLNLSRRKEGHTNLYFLGPQTYMHAVTKSLLGQMIDVNPGTEEFDKIRSILNSSGFIQTYIEHPVYETFLYRKENDQIDFDHELEKKNFYQEYEIKHWTNVW